MSAKWDRTAILARLRMEDGAIARQTRRCAKRVSEEGAEFRLAHLTRGHGELAMASGGHRMPPIRTLQGGL